MFVLALISALMSPTHLFACNVPVFRYALERWLPDNYEMVIFHDGSLSEEAKRQISFLRAFVDKPGGYSANIALSVVDVRHKMAEEPAKLLQIQKPATLPWLVVRYPDSANINADFYAGPLNGDALKGLFDSPLRRAVAENLMRGDTAVWILIESGNRQQDDTKAAWLRAHLTMLEKTLKLPELTDTPKDKLRIDVPLKIEFSLVRLSRQDASETQSLRMLLGMEEDLAARREPIIYPVFGRGMALWAIVGKGITEQNITRAAEFLVAPCSCEIKAQNPGVDLLLTANWDERLTDRLTTASAQPSLTGLIPQSPTEQVGPLTPSADVSVSPDGTRPLANNDALWRNVVLALGGGLLCLIVASVVGHVRRRA